MKKKHKIAVRIQAENKKFRGKLKDAFRGIRNGLWYVKKGEPLCNIYTSNPLWSNMKIWSHMTNKFGTIKLWFYR